MAAKKRAKAKSKPRRPKKLVASPKIKAAAKKSAAKAAKGAPLKKLAAIAKKPAKTQGDQIVLHGLHLSIPTGKVGLMLSMCGAKWAYRHIDISKGQHRTPQFLAMNRFGQVPVLQHGDKFISQSNAILSYLAGHTGKFQGRSESDRWRIAEWLQWEQDNVYSLGQVRAFTTIMPKHEEVVKFARARSESALKMLDRHLGGSKFLVGTAPTIADIAVFPWIATAHEGGFAVANYPNVHAWAERMLVIPGAAHPYTILPKEDRVAA